MINTVFSCGYYCGGKEEQLLGRVHVSVARMGECVQVDCRYSWGTFPLLLVD